MKAIIIGTSLSGKTTVIKHLRKNYDFNVKEIDEELTKINGGQFPKDARKKHDVLAPKVIKQILSSKNIFEFRLTPNIGKITQLAIFANCLRYALATSDIRIHWTK